MSLLRLAPPVGRSYNIYRHGHIVSLEELALLTIITMNYIYSYREKGGMGRQGGKERGGGEGRGGREGERRGGRK